MKIALLFITDGRESAPKAWSSLAANLPVRDYDYRVVRVNDSDHKLGFHGAIQEGWDRIPADVQYVFHQEDDFIHDQAVPLSAMVWLLEQHQDLAQVSLKRQAVNEREREAGGIVEADPVDFSHQTDGDITWTEHRRYFTTNPSLYRRNLISAGWPQEPNSEGAFTHRLLDNGYRFGIYGAPFDPPRVTHVGKRQGTGY